MKEITSILRSWNEAEVADKPAVIATVVRVEGSHYRRPGARMFAALDSFPVGSVSGGCLESDVILRASEVTHTGKAALIHYDTTTESDLVFGTGMGCGGAVDILLEPLDSPAVQQLKPYFQDCVEKRQAFAVATVFKVTGDCPLAIGDRVIHASGGGERIGQWDQTLFRDIIHELHRVLTSRQTYNKTVSLATGTAQVLFEYIYPPVALLICGAGDDALPLCRSAAGLGWQVTVVDHRTERVTPARFPEAKLLICQPDSCQGTIDPDKFDAAVVMTHNYHHDQVLLGWLAQTEIKYVGLLGAAKRAERIMNELVARGTVADAGLLNRIHAPIGLDLKAEGAAEIALSILAEIQMVLGGGTGVSLTALRGRSGSHGPIQAERIG